MTDTKRIWWCEEHEKQGSSAGCDLGYWEEYVEDNTTLEPLLCRMVELQLAPLSALIIERDENGRIPSEGFEAAARVLRQRLSTNGFKMKDAEVRAGHWIPNIIMAYLDALALSVATKEET